MLKILPEWDWFVELSTMLPTINLQSCSITSASLKTNYFCFHGGGGVSTYHFLKALIKYP